MTSPSFLVEKKKQKTFDEKISKLSIKKIKKIFYYNLVIILQNRRPKSVSFLF